MPTIITIVEGDGEVQAVPILIRRIAEVVTPGSFPDVPKPIRVRRDGILKPGEIERSVEFAADQAGPDGRILILLDTDDDCPRDLAPRRGVQASRRWVTAPAGGGSGTRLLPRRLAIRASGAPIQRIRHMRTPDSNAGIPP